MRARGRGGRTDRAGDTQLLCMFNKRGEGEASEGIPHQPNLNRPQQQLPVSS